MKNRPILFSGPMVRAILGGRKTQTRRVVKCDLYDIERLAEPSEWNAGRANPNMIPYENWGRKQGCGLFVSTDGTIFAMPCHYGAPGDRLWVRETWKTCAVYDSYAPSQIDSGAALLWLADNSKRINGPEDWGKVRPSIYMTKWASRIVLEITEIRVEPLQDISRADAKAEGFWPSEYNGLESFDGIPYGNANLAFKACWEKINGKKHPWSSNPLVWVVEFKHDKCQTT